MTPSRASTARGRRDSRRARACWGRGGDPGDASATNDSTSTTADAAANSDLGMGRSARPTRPCAKTGAGSSTRPQSKNDDGPAGAGPSSLQEWLRAGYEHFAVDVPVAPDFGGGVGFGAKVSFEPNLCFFCLHPVVEMSE